MLRPHAATITGNFADLSLTIPRARPPPGSLVPGPGLPADSIEASIVGDTPRSFGRGPIGKPPRARRRASAAAGRSRRRTALEDATVERFDPVDIYERDGWRCQLCGEPVDPHSTWPDPLYPSLEHIVPLAAGGKHSRANTQLAHWICNVRKGARHQ